MGMFLHKSLNGFPLKPSSKAEHCARRAVYVNTVNVMHFTAPLSDTKGGANEYKNIQQETQIKMKIKRK